MKQKLYLILIFYFLSFLSVKADLFISELFPNTYDDANLEYIELYNSWSTIIDLTWYILKDKSGKQYSFWSWVTLNILEKKKYYRWETSIILNNTNEEVFLYNSSWELIDAVNYSSSTKDKSISFIFTDNNTISEIKDFEIEVQSWLKYIDWNNWLCPEEWSWICKINLNAEWIDTSTFDCKWDFWIYATNYEYWTSKKCNPWYIDYPKWNFSIELKVIDKNDSSNYKTTSIFIKNTSNDTVYKEKEKLNIDKPKITVESWLNSERECINKKNCNINFRYIEKSKLEKCRWDFWGWIYDPWDNTKCNPSYVKFWTWEYLINLRVYEKWDYFNFKESIYTIKNIVSTKIEKETREIVVSELKANISLNWKIWANKELVWNKIICYETCSINFDGTESSWDIQKYSWSFWNGELSNLKNPWYIKYEDFWEYKVYLWVVSSDWRKDISEFHVEFREKIKTTTKKKSKSIISKTYAKKENKKNIEENIIQEKKKEVDILDKHDNNDKEIIILLYILIWVFTLILIVLILKKEKLL